MSLPYAHNWRSPGRVRLPVLGPPVAMANRFHPGHEERVEAHAARVEAHEARLALLEWTRRQRDDPGPKPKPKETPERRRQRKEIVRLAYESRRHEYRRGLRRRAREALAVTTPTNTEDF